MTDERDNRVRWPVIVSARLLLLDLELPDILGARGVGERPSQVANRPTSRRWLRCVSIEKRRMVMSSIRRWRSGLIGPIWISSSVNRGLVKRAFGERL